ncbi:hypothetical protein ACFOWX_10040 [Sphingorhabdus arenilitoris]|uniref:Secreted protein n=1 Tax=Sphingorhabdus arenilitoris TaxID=1490041 RepID=A0ABV8RHD0_9SPHN
MKKNAALIISIFAMAAATPAFAQTENNNLAGPQDEDVKVNQLIVYGDDPCPESTDSEIVVCVRQAEPYRIPKNLRSDPNDRSKEAWTNRVLAYEYVAANGIGSCSSIGAGGFTGCGIKAIDQAYAERAEDPALTFGLLIAEARRNRLAGIDAEAEDIEQTVLAEERAAALKKLQAQADNVEADPESVGEDDTPGAQPLPDPR